MMELEMPEWTRQNMAKGRAEGRASMLETLVEEKFGAVPAAVRERFDTASFEQCQEWMRRILGAKTLDEVFS